MIPIVVIAIVVTYGFYWYSYSFGGSYSATLKYISKEINQSKVVELKGDSAAFTPVMLEETDTSSINTKTSGEKATGEKSKGTITVFNATTDIKAIKAGTTASCISNACSGLNFTLEKDINLGPGSSDEVAVVAGDIGENYNLSAGAGRFKVGSFDSKTEVLASNVKPIEGGTPKKMVKIATKSDLQKAEDGLLKSLRESLKNRVTGNQESTNYLIPETDTAFTVKKVESKSDVKEGDEAETINTTVTAKLSVEVYPRGDINKAVEQFKKELIPNGYELDEKSANIKYELVTADKNAFQLKIEAKAVALPEIDLDTLRKELAGKSYDQAEKVLSRVPNLQGYTQNVEPKSFPKFMWKLPNNPKKIEIKLSTEKQSV